MQFSVNIPPHTQKNPFERTISFPHRSSCLKWTLMSNNPYSIPCCWLCQRWLIGALRIYFIILNDLIKTNLAFTFRKILWYNSMMCENIHPFSHCCLKNTEGLGELRNDYIWKSFLLAWFRESLLRSKGFLNFVWIWQLLSSLLNFKNH